MVIDVTATWARKELQEGEIDSMCIKFLHFWSEILFWSLKKKHLTHSKSTVNLEGFQDIFAFFPQPYLKKQTNKNATMFCFLGL